MRSCLDVGLQTFAALSDGTLIENPRHFRAAVGRIHARVAEQRRDFHHQVSARLVAEYGFIAVEDLDIRGLPRGMLAKSVHDAGWAQFLSFLTYKAESAGTRLEQVSAHGTSQTCSECGATAKKGLGERLHRCPCGLVQDRDVAAARVILARGHAAWTGPPDTAAASAAA
ncbi:MAG TPA: transposase [Longimicrobiales bacterium]|nr:transposase [Longimicrobiales bacterium]